MILTGCFRPTAPSPTQGPELCRRLRPAAEAFWVLCLGRPAWAVLSSRAKSFQSSRDTVTRAVTSQGGRQSRGSSSLLPGNSVRRPHGRAHLPGSRRTGSYMDVLLTSAAPRRPCSPKSPLLGPSSSSCPDLRPHRGSAGAYGHSHVACPLPPLPAHGQASLLSAVTPRRSALLLWPPPWPPPRQKHCARSGKCRLQTEQPPAPMRVGVRGLAWASSALTRRSNTQASGAHNDLALVSTLPAVCLTRHRQTGGRPAPTASESSPPPPRRGRRAASGLRREFVCSDSLPRSRFQGKAFLIPTAQGSQQSIFQEPRLLDTPSHEKGSTPLSSEGTPQATMTAS